MSLKIKTSSISQKTNYVTPQLYRQTEIPSNHMSAHLSSSLLSFIIWQNGTVETY